jgi:hypothetical protein
MTTTAMTTEMTITTTHDEGTCEMCDLLRVRLVGVTTETCARSRGACVGFATFATVQDRVAEAHARTEAREAELTDDERAATAALVAEVNGELADWADDVGAEWTKLADDDDPLPFSAAETVDILVNEHGFDRVWIEDRLDMTARYGDKFIEAVADDPEADYLGVPAAVVYCERCGCNVARSCVCAKDCQDHPKGLAASVELAR